MTGVNGMQEITRLVSVGHPTGTSRMTNSKHQMALPGLGEGVKAHENTFSVGVVGHKFGISIVEIIEK